MQGKRAIWPDMWEAAAVAFAAGETGFSIQAWDSHFIFKGISIGLPDCAQAVALTTFAHGPQEMNRYTGNLCWRISTFRNGWQTPFLRYREWYWNNYQLEKAAHLRPEWLDNIALAVSWCPTDPNLLDAHSQRTRRETCSRSD